MRSLKSNLLAVHDFRPAPIFVRRHCKSTHLFINTKQTMKKSSISSRIYYSSSVYSVLSARLSVVQRNSRDCIWSSTSPGQVTIEAPVPYAAIHNEGGDIISCHVPSRAHRHYCKDNLCLFGGLWQFCSVICGSLFLSRMSKGTKKEAVSGTFDTTS